MLNPEVKTARRVYVALIGSRGIPPRYGGAETFVYELSKRLKEHFDILVTCESDRFGADVYQGIARLYIYAPQPHTTIPIIYDIIATLYTLKKAKIDIIFYVAPDGAYAAIAAKLAGKRVVINTDGLEWKRLLIRERFASFSQKPVYLLAAFALLVAEFLACKIPDVTVADSLAIKHYLERRWKPSNVVYIPYGIRVLPTPNQNIVIRILSKYNLSPFNYYLTVGRFVPENNMHIVIQAYKEAKRESKLALVGFVNANDPYTRYLTKLKGDDSRIILIPPRYNLSLLAALRSNCRAYIHPYAVGGTNPSLLEQLQFRRPIIAYDTPFHREILGSKGMYFRTVGELSEIITEMESSDIKEVTWNVPTVYTWHAVSATYRKVFMELLGSRKKCAASSLRTPTQRALPHLSHHGTED